MASGFKVWVKLIDKVEEDAFKVDCDVGMDIDSLKKVIVAVSGLPPGGVRKVYPSCDENAKAYAPDDVVVKPVRGAVGAKASNPYYYSLTPAAGNWCCICST